MALVPGPVVGLIVANSLKIGARAELLNVAGTQIGLALMLLVLLFGLNAIVVFTAEWFIWIKLVGAVHLVWLGWKLLRGSETAPAPESPGAGRGYVWQGLAVNLSNPKVLLFVSAFIPQLMTRAAGYLSEAMLLMAIFMVVTAVCDSAYAIAAGSLRATLSRQARRIVERGSGLLLIASGVWLAAMRR